MNDHRVFQYIFITFYFLFRYYVYLVIPSYKKIFKTFSKFMTVETTDLGHHEQLYVLSCT